MSPRNFHDEAFVLKTYDIGDADRLCILLTKEHGKLAVRARSVRKPKSRMGPSLLPLQSIEVELQQSSAGYYVSHARCINANEQCRTNISAYQMAQQAMKFIDMLIQDQESVPEIYALLAEFFTAMRFNPAEVLGDVFALRLLRILGMMPSVGHSCVSHEPLSNDDDIVYSQQYGGFCLQHEDPVGMALSSQCLQSVMLIEHTSMRDAASLYLSVADELSVFVSALLGNQLGASVAGRSLSLSSSSAVTPT